MTRFLAAVAVMALSATSASAAVLRPVEVSRFAHFVDMNSVRREGDAASFRYLLVTPETFEAGGEPFWAGWVYMTIDCAARTADLTAFQSIRVGGVEGPRTADGQPGRPIAAEGRDAALEEVVCYGNRPSPRPDVASVEEAVLQGRAWLPPTP